MSTLAKTTLISTGSAARHGRCRRPTRASGKASSSNIAVKSESVAAPVTTRLAGGTIVSGTTTGEETDRIEPTDQTLAGNANESTAQRKTTTQQSAA